MSRWVRPSACDPGEACIEVAGIDAGMVAIRGSDDLPGYEKWYSRGEWEAFVAGVRAGDFDGLFAGVPERN